MEVEVLEEGADGECIGHELHSSANAHARFADKLASKAQKITIKLPWEIMTIYSDNGRPASLGTNQKKTKEPSVTCMQGVYYA